MEAILKEGFGELGLRLPEGSAERFNAYFEFLDEHSKLMNLTAISGKEDTAKLHFLDCAALLCFHSFENKRVIDVGSGAGFPGLPLKIISPGMKLSLLDSQKKRVDFLESLCAHLGYGDIDCLWLRAEEAPPEMREDFDIALSRAVARLNILAELCLPFVKVGGVFLAMKGPDPAAEIDEAHSAFEKLGGQLQNIFEYTIPGSDVRHTVIAVKKIKHTPSTYPRRYAKIQKSPL